MEKRLEHNDHAFVLDVESDIEQHRYQTAFTKEPETVAWIEEVIEDGQVLLDVGANIGVFTLYAAACHPHSKIYACEPAFHNFYKLCQNIQSNQFADRVIPLGFGLGDSHEFSELQLSSNEAGSASHSFNAATAQKTAATGSLKQIIAVGYIDDLIKRKVIEPPQHIKIDVDGVEGAVINGSLTYLQNSSLRSVLIELDHKLSDSELILTIMKESGFVRNHQLNAMTGHSRERRQAAGHGHIENIIFTRTT